MTRGDESEPDNQTPYWGPLIESIDPAADGDDPAPSIPKTLLDALFWFGCIFMALGGSFYVVMIVLFGKPSHHWGIFSLLCLAPFSACASSFGIMNCAPGRGLFWFVPAGCLSWLGWWALGLPQASGFIH